MPTPDAFRSALEAQAEKAANLADTRELLKRARQRSRAVPAKTIERDIRMAMNRVRGVTRTRRP